MRGLKGIILRAKSSSTFLLGISYYVSLCFALLRGIVVSKALKPEMFGLWSTMLIVLSYTSYSHLGYFFTLVKDVPVMYDRQERRHHCSVLLVFSVIISSVIAAAFLVYFGFFFTGSQLLRKSFMIISLAIVFEGVINFSYKYFRAIEDFRALYLYTIFSSLFSFALISFSVLRWSYNGLLISYVANNIILMAIPFIVFRMEISLLRMDFPLLKKKIYLALKYLFLDILGNTFRNLDKMIIVRAFSFFSMGIYSFFYRIIQPINLFFDAVIDVMFPRLVRIEKRNPQEALDYLKSRLFLISLFFLLLLPFYILAVLMLVNIFLKEYASGNSLVLYLPALFYLYIFNNSMMTYLISKDKEVYTKAVLVAVITLFILASFFALKIANSYTTVVFCNIAACIVQLFCYCARIFGARCFKTAGFCLVNTALVLILSRLVLGGFEKFSPYFIK